LTTPTPNRFPKGWFALVMVYAFTGAAMLTSIIFSLLLFLSFDEQPLMKGLFGALAIIFELGKFYVWYELGERRARRDRYGATSALVIYLVLAGISIGGSIGGINSATTMVLSEEAQQRQRTDRYDEQIASIDRQIALNEEAARKYIEMKYISTGLTRMQEENKKLREEQDALRRERNNLPVAERSSVGGLMVGLAEGTGVSVAQVQFWLVMLLSVLLDFFAAFFVGLIGDENRFRHQWRYRQQLGTNSTERADRPQPAQDQAAEQAAGSAAAAESVAAVKQARPPLYEQIRDQLQSGSVPCSKKAVIDQLKLSQQEVSQIFHHLMEDGILAQKSNRRFYLLEDA